jgi:hypothetical protein
MFACRLAYHCRILRAEGNAIEGGHLVAKVSRSMALEDKILPSSVSEMDAQSVVCFLAELFNKERKSPDFRQSSVWRPSCCKQR